jgi:hypothetical protein
MEIADLLMHGHGPTAIAELTDLSVNYVKNRLGDLRPSGSCSQPRSTSSA